MEPDFRVISQTALLSLRSPTRSDVSLVSTEKARIRDVLGQFTTAACATGVPCDVYTRGQTFRQTRLFLNQRLTALVFQQTQMPVIGIQAIKTGEGLVASDDVPALAPAHRNRAVAIEFTPLAGLAPLVVICENAEVRQQLVAALSLLRVVPPPAATVSRKMAPVEPVTIPAIASRHSGREIERPTPTRARYAKSPLREGDVSPSVSPRAYIVDEHWRQYRSLSPLERSVRSPRSVPMLQRAQTPPAAARFCGVCAESAENYEEIVDRPTTARNKTRRMLYNEPLPSSSSVTRGRRPEVQQPSPLNDGAALSPVPETPRQGSASRRSTSSQDPPRPIEQRARSERSTKSKNVHVELTSEATPRREQLHRSPSSERMPKKEASPKTETVVPAGSVRSTAAPASVRSAKLSDFVNEALKARQRHTYKSIEAPRSQSGRSMASGRLVATPVEEKTHRQASELDAGEDDENTTVNVELLSATQSEIYREVEALVNSRSNGMEAAELRPAEERQVEVPQLFVTLDPHEGPGAVHARPRFVTESEESFDISASQVTPSYVQVQLRKQLMKQGDDHQDSPLSAEATDWKPAKTLSPLEKLKLSRIGVPTPFKSAQDMRESQYSPAEAAAEFHSSQAEREVSINLH